MTTPLFPAKMPSPAAFFLLFICSLLLLTGAGCQSTKKADAFPPTDAEPFVYRPEEDALSFGEIWGYVMVGREKEFSANLPVSDVGYFVGLIGAYSEILPCKSRDAFFSAYPGRVHLVTSLESKSQAHLLLDPALPLRKKIIQGLLEAAASYDGLQIDWEVIGERDVENFFSFLQEIKNGLGEKIFSVAVRARLKAQEKDPFDYERIAKIADRMIVMAYDEHWSTSKPGAVASLDWSRRIAQYALSTVPAEKIVMGLPFYGRSWSDYKDAPNAFGSLNIARIQADNDIHPDDIKRENGIPYFTYSRKIGVTVWYNDRESIRALSSMYRNLGIQNIGFWRVGQERPEVWQEFTLSGPQSSSGSPSDTAQ